VIQPRPAQDVARRELNDELRRARSGEHEHGATLVPVEGGEPMPAEEPPPARPHPTF
jgi:hypothetical protein